MEAKREEERKRRESMSEDPQGDLYSGERGLVAPALGKP
jgi:hypothetical protein